MVYSRIVTVFMLSVIVQVKSESVVYRGTAKDGTYSEVRQSSVPGGETKSITTFSTRVLGGNSPPSGELANRFGMDIDPSPSLPPLKPLNLLGSLGGLNNPAAQLLGGGLFGGDVFGGSLFGRGNPAAQMIGAGSMNPAGLFNSGLFSGLPQIPKLQQQRANKNAGDGFGSPHGEPSLRNSPSQGNGPNGLL